MFIFQNISLVTTLEIVQVKLYNNFSYNEQRIAVLNIFHDITAANTCFCIDVMSSQRRKAVWCKHPRIFPSEWKLIRVKSNRCSLNGDMAEPATVSNFYPNPSRNTISVKAIFEGDVQICADVQYNLYHVCIFLPQSHKHPRPR